MRSVPERCCGPVMQTLAPNASPASAMRSSSVAMTTSRARLSEARSQACCSIGLPPMSLSGLPGNRVEA